MSTAMTRSEREAFLADVHVGVLCVDEPGRGPLAAPVWYWYEPGGDVHVVTGAGSRKGLLLRQATRASLVVQTEAPPYKYVTVEGPLALGTPEYERDIRKVAHRYLGPVMGDRYLKSTGGGENVAGQLLVRITPERWLTVDYGKA
ncbi:MAG: pyridoxamine 5'-phosphate oxidase [Chloroflexi bacterium]|nr:pyridoxamine 5'-phosphate oxidase [Chloroflexota bacterium]